jgi:hypothetical protein
LFVHASVRLQTPKEKEAYINVAINQQAKLPTDPTMEAWSVQIDEKMVTVSLFVCLPSYPSVRVCNLPA